MAPKKSTPMSRDKKLQVLDLMLKRTKKLPITNKINAAQLRLKAARVRSAGGMSPFGGVSEVSAAPVTLGNTVRSVPQTVRPTPLGVAITGRDFVMALGGTTTAFSNWCLQGGMSMSPVALNASSLRGYFQSYESFRWLRVVVHYITSSPTSLPGDVMIMYHNNHGGPKVNHLSANFMSYAMSTDSAVLGPQWTNHSVQVFPSGESVKTDIMNAEDVEHQADGELLFYTKNTTNGTSPDQPGYIIIDYEVEFMHRMVNPRLASLPTGLCKWFPLAMGFSGAFATNENVNLDSNFTSSYSGAAVTPNGIAVGQIYQVVFDFQNATFGGTFAAGSNLTFMSVITAFNYAAIGVSNATVYPIDTGCTLYMVYRGGFRWNLYANYDAALSGQPMVWSAASAGASFTSAAAICCVGSVNSAFAQASIG